ncbi:MAG: FAD-binding oxidoreductase [Parvibaculum sp.]|uniref:NAD(P)/FAD-dependent oxidoreductase n=1 Tax=Parvibaculum sp. TaxID=2024848 RepID=UPI0028493046|nr:FAD-binding oxidoreductase [Parvibaculum sp.]MDR3498615.1 FAD-binding oxidoreductase [Parvibaculum sp.]
MMPVNDASTPFLDVSPYVNPPSDLQPALSADIHADVAIVGGGYTGLSTALALRERGISSVVLERDFCGYGASGRNAGHLTPTICKDLPTAMMLFGRETAANLARYADFCVESAERMIEDYGIDCDYNRSGNIMAVIHPSQEKRLRKATEAAVSLGAKIHFVEPGEMRERGVPRAFLSGSMEEAGGTLHTGKFVLGLRKAALAHGIKIYEKTAVQCIEETKPIRVVTAGGTVTADRIVMASNAYAPEIGRPGNLLGPLYITLFETAPLSEAQLDAIGGWGAREGIYTAHESMESYRLTAQRTIIGGSKDVQFFYDCAPHNHGGDGDARKMSVINAFRQRFPMLGELPIAHAWAGWCGFTLNFMPIVGRAADNPAYHYAVAYNGHGIAQATTMGALLADLLQDKPNPWHDLICRKPAYMMPSKTLMYLSVKTLLTVLNGIDRRIDNKARRGNFGR